MYYTLRHNGNEFKQKAKIERSHDYSRGEQEIVREITVYPDCAETLNRS